MSFEQTLEKYAALAVNVGVNIQRDKHYQSVHLLKLYNLYVSLQKKHINLVQNTYMWIGMMRR